MILFFPHVDLARMGRGTKPAERAKQHPPTPRAELNSVPLTRGSKYVINYSWSSPIPPEAIIKCPAGASQNKIYKGFFSRISWNGPEYTSFDSARPSYVINYSWSSPIPPLGWIKCLPGGSQNKIYKGFFPGFPGMHLNIPHSTQPDHPLY